MIKLKKQLPDPNQYEFGETAIKPMKIYEYNVELKGWQQIIPEVFADVKIGEIVSGKFRFMLELVVEGKPVFIVSNEIDRQNARKKYPQAIIIDIAQLVGFFKRPLDEMRLALLPTLMMSMTVFPDGKVIA